MPVHSSAPKPSWQTPRGQWSFTLTSPVTPSANDWMDSKPWCDGKNAGPVRHKALMLLSLTYGTWPITKGPQLHSFLANGRLVRPYQVDHVHESTFQEESHIHMEAVGHDPCSLISWLTQARELSALRKLCSLEGWEMELDTCQILSPAARIKTSL